MLRFSEDQIQAFRHLTLRRFLSENATFLRERFPDATRDMDDNELAELLETAIGRGKRYGVTSAYDVRRLAECLLLHGRDFPGGEAHAWARPLLESEGMTGREKMNALVLLECVHGRP